MFRSGESSKQIGHTKGFGEVATGDAGDFGFEVEPRPRNLLEDRVARRAVVGWVLEVSGVGSGTWIPAAHSTLVALSMYFSIKRSLFQDMDRKRSSAASR